MGFYQKRSITKNVLLAMNRSIYYIRILFFLSAIHLSSCGSPNQNQRAKETTTDTLSNDSLLTLVQQQTFQYFWEGAEKTSGLARERIHIDGNYPQNDQDVVTIGGGGFGVMNILV